MYSDLLTPKDSPLPYEFMLAKNEHDSTRSTTESGSVLAPNPDP